MGLIFVPTPLGNLRDITLRALDVLGSCDLIASEDTRVTRRLLSAHKISGKTILRYDQHSPPASMDMLVEQATAHSVAVMTDAGTPGISDPGRDLIVRARASGISIEVLPGGTAFICAAVLSGFKPAPLLFDGFLPRTLAGRRNAIQEAMRINATTVWYESPHRLASTLEQIAHDAPDANVFVARELTKKFEQHLLGTAAEVLAALPSPLKGEITLVFSPPATTLTPCGNQKDTAACDKRIEALLHAGESVAAIAKTLSQSGFGERKEIYARASARQRMRRM